jgi:hypothetical protein
MNLLVFPFLVFAWCSAFAEPVTGKIKNLYFGAWSGSVIIREERLKVFLGLAGEHENTKGAYKSCLGLGWGAQ